MKYIIVFVVFAALAAVAGSVIVGMKHFDGTVSGSPYEEGLLWDEMQKNKLELGWSVETGGGKMETGENRLVLLVNGKDGEPLHDAAVSVMISRPATNIHDRTYQAMHVQNGKYDSMVHFPLYGYWDLKVMIKKGDKELALKKRIFVVKGGLTK